jgi:hypothetical protein
MKNAVPAFVVGRHAQFGETRFEHRNRALILQMLNDEIPTPGSAVRVGERLKLQAAGFGSARHLMQLLLNGLRHAHGAVQYDGTGNDQAQLRGYGKGQMLRQCSEVLKRNNQADAN